MAEGLFQIGRDAIATAFGTARKKYLATLPVLNLGYPQFSDVRFFIS